MLLYIGKEDMIKIDINHNYIDNRILWFFFASPYKKSKYWKSNQWIESTFHLITRTRYPISFDFDSKTWTRYPISFDFDSKTWRKQGLILIIHRLNTVMISVHLLAFIQIWDFIPDVGDIFAVDIVILINKQHV